MKMQARKVNCFVLFSFLRRNSENFGTLELNLEKKKTWSEKALKIEFDHGQISLAIGTHARRYTEAESREVDLFW